MQGITVSDSDVMVCPDSKSLRIKATSPDCRFSSAMNEGTRKEPGHYTRTAQKWGTGASGGIADSGRVSLNVQEYFAMSESPQLQLKYRYNRAPPAAGKSNAEKPAAVARISVFPGNTSSASTPYRGFRQNRILSKGIRLSEQESSPLLATRPSRRPHSWSTSNFLGPLEGPLSPQSPSQGCRSHYPVRRISLSAFILPSHPPQIRPPQRFPPPPQ